MNRKYLRAAWALLFAALFVPALEAKKHHGETFFKEGQAAEAKGDWEAALRFYQQAVDENPTDPDYLIGMRRSRFQVGQKHVEAGQKLRTAGSLTDAIQEFQLALIADPSSAIAIQELKRTQQMLDRSKQGGVAPEEIGLTPSEKVRREDELHVAAMEGPPGLKPVIRSIPPLKMNNQPPRILYETVAKLAGINVAFDSQYTPPPRGFSVELGSSTVEQAFDQLAIYTHTFWKPISSNTIFVTEDNVTKRRDYEDQVVKVFYVTNATSVQEFQEIATAIRTVGDIRRVYTYNAQKAMVVRGTVDQVALADRLIRSLDKPKSEVVVELIFMEVNTARTRDLAAALATAGTAGINIPLLFTPRNSITVNGGTNSSNPPSNGNSGSSTPSTPSGNSNSGFVTLAELGHISSADFATTLPGALLQAMLSDNRTKVLSTPQVRVSDGVKGELQVGDRIPYATGSFQPGVGTVGVSPLVSTQFNFADTGITMIITPQVHSATEMTLHVEITVSAVKEYLTIGGTGGLSQPVITQNKNTTDLRLRDGEVSILSGLNQTQDSLSLNGTPGLINVPILGQLLGGVHHTEKDRTELLIAMVPHIVRTPDYTPDDLRGIFAGWEQTVKINYAPPSETPGAQTPAGQAPAGQPPPGQPPAGIPPAGVQPGIPGPGAAPPPPPGPVGQAPPGQARLSLSPTPPQVRPNTDFTVTIQLDNATDVFSVSPLRIRFDPAKVRLSDVNAAGLMAQATLVKDIRNDTGEATVTLTSAPGSNGINGSGALATLRFTAVGTGAAAISIVEAGLKNTQVQPVPATVGSTQVTIQ